jgi:hypothetical protein
LVSDGKLTIPKTPKTFVWGIPRMLTTAQQFSGARDTLLHTVGARLERLQGLAGEMH